MNKKGFTLIELLVVIAIIGLLSTLSVVALGSAREKANDSKRLSDIKQVQTALELYYTDNNHYPTSSVAIPLGEANAACLENSDAGFVVATGCAADYMGLVPSDPTPGQQYLYTATTNEGSTYTITATLEGTVNGIGPGNVTATPSGIQAPTS